MTPNLLHYTITLMLQRVIIVFLTLGFINQAYALQWRDKTTNWSHNPEPVLGDWGFDRPGYPPGLYVHGATAPTGRRVENPIIYDNDEYADVLDDDVLMVLASLGKVNLAGLISTPMRAVVFKSRRMPAWEKSAYLTRERAVQSGMKHVPPITLGNTTNDPQKNTDGARLYVEAITRQHKEDPSRPVIVAMGGQSLTLASACLIDNTIADKVIVFYVGAYAYNGHDRWASEMVCRRMLVLDMDHHHWPKQARPDRFEALPSNDTASFDVVGGQWKVLFDLDVPFLNAPYRDKFNPGGVVSRLQHNASVYGNGDAYGDGSFLVALNPACFKDVVLKQVRGGRVLWVNGPDAINSAAFHAIAYPTLSNPAAYGRKN